MAIESYSSDKMYKLRLIVKLRKRKFYSILNEK